VCFLVGSVRSLYRACFQTSREARHSAALGRGFADLGFQFQGLAMVGECHLGGANFALNFVALIARDTVLHHVSVEIPQALLQRRDVFPDSAVRSWHKVKQSHAIAADIFLLASTQQAA